MVLDIFIFICWPLLSRMTDRLFGCTSSLNNNFELTLFASLRTVGNFKSWCTLAFVTNRGALEIVINTIFVFLGICCSLELNTVGPHWF